MNNRNASSLFSMFSARATVPGLIMSKKKNVSQKLNLVLFKFRAESGAKVSIGRP